MAFFDQSIPVVLLLPTFPQTPKFIGPPRQFIILHCKRHQTELTLEAMFCTSGVQTNDLKRQHLNLKLHDLKIILVVSSLGA